MIIGLHEDQVYERFGVPRTKSRTQGRWVIYYATPRMTVYLAADETVNRVEYHDYLSLVRWIVHLK